MLICIKVLLSVFKEGLTHLATLKVPRGPLLKSKLELLGGGEIKFLLPSARLSPHGVHTPSHDLELGWINFLTLAPCNLTFVCTILCLSPPENRKVPSCSSCYCWHVAQCPAHRRHLMYFCSLSFYLLREFPGASLLPFSAAKLLFSLDHGHDPEKLIVVLDLIYKVTHSLVPSSLGTFKVASSAGAS